MIDLLGFDEGKATELLKEKGVKWTTQITEPPAKKVAEGYYKVIKQELEDDTYKLILCKVPDDFR